MIATVRFEDGQLDLVLAALVTYKKHHPSQKVAVAKLIDKLQKIKTART